MILFDYDSCCLICFNTYKYCIDSINHPYSYFCTIISLICSFIVHLHCFFLQVAHAYTSFQTEESSRGFGSGNVSVVLPMYRTSPFANL